MPGTLLTNSVLTEEEPVSVLVIVTGADVDRCTAGATDNVMLLYSVSCATSLTSVVMLACGAVALAGSSMVREVKVINGDGDGDGDDTGGGTSLFTGTLGV
jgi:hypothetical protein